MTSYENNTIIDTDINKYEVETDYNNNYVDIQEFGLDNPPYTYYTNEWEEFK